MAPRTPFAHVAAGIEGDKVGRVSCARRPPDRRDERRRQSSLRASFPAWHDQVRDKDLHGLAVLVQGSRPGDSSTCSPAPAKGFCVSKGRSVRFKRSL